MTIMTAPKLADRPAQPYMGIRTQAAMDALPHVIPEALDAVFAWLAARGIAPAGAPFIRYHVIDMAAQLDIELGVPVSSTIAGDGRVQAGELPAGRYASLIYTGIDNGIEGNRALIEWAAANGIQWDRWDDPRGDAFRSRYETFLTGPDENPDPAQWQTEVAILVAE